MKGKRKKWMKKEKCFWGCDRHTLVPLFYYYNRLLLRTLIMNESSFPHYILYLPSTPYYILHPWSVPSIHFLFGPIYLHTKIFQNSKNFHSNENVHNMVFPLMASSMFWYAGLENGFLIAFYESFSSYIFLIELLLISKDSIKNMEE